MDTERFKPVDDMDDLYEELDLKKDEKIIGVFSRLDKWKGHKLFLEAVKMLVGRDLKCKFLICGEGAERSDIEKQINNLNMQKEVLILGHRKDISRLMNICDSIVNPSIEPEPFGRTIIEAMACEKVIIATNMGGPTEIIENGVDGFLIKPDGVELAKAISKILNNDELRESVSRNARKKVLEKFSIERQICLIEDIYDNLDCANK